MSWLARLGLCVMALVVAAACGGSSSASGSGSRPATVTVGLALQPPKLIFIGFYVARDEGFFARHHLNVQLAGFQDGVKSLKGVAGGSVDLGATSSDDVIAAVSQGGGFKAVWSYATPVDSIMLGGPSVKTPADLRGKTIAITDPGGFADSQARAVLTDAGIPASAVRFQSFPGRSAFVPALTTGKVDAAVFHVDDGLTAQKLDPNLNVVAKIWQDAPKWWYGAVTVRADYARQHGQVLEDFIQAMIEADRWMYSHKSQVVQLATRYTQEDPAVVSQSYDFLAAAHEWPVNDGLRQDMIEYTIQQEFDNHQIDRKPRWQDVVDKRYVDAVLSKVGREKTGY